jgi:hypothetical protein
MAMLLLWLGLYQLATGSSHSGYSLFTFKARIGYNIARFAQLLLKFEQKNKEKVI